MEFLGVGASELIFIILIAIIVLGPKDMQKAAMTIAKWIRSILMSDVWMATQQVSREAKKQWMHFIREANEDLNKINNEANIAGKLESSRAIVQNKTPLRPVPTGIKSTSVSEVSSLSQSNQSENSIQPSATNGKTPSLGTESTNQDGTETESNQDD